MKNSSIAFMASFKVFALLFCVVLPNAGCKKLINEIKLTREQMVFALDEATTNIHNAPATWQSVLTELQEQFSEDVSSNMAARVSVLKNEVVGQVTTGIICLMDAAANRAVFGLQRLKAELLGLEMPLPIPYLCSTSHHTIDLNLSATVRRTVTFYGYDFVQRSKVSAYFVKKDGTEQYLDNAIHFQDNYHFTLNLAPYPDNTLKLYSYVSIRFDGEELSNLVIQQDNIPPPTQTKSITPPIFGHIPRHIAGDDKIGEKGAAISLTAKVEKSHRQVNLRVWMNAVEQGGDRSKAEGWSDPHIFYTAPNGWHIKRVEAPSYYSILQSWKGNGNEANLQLELGLWTVYGYNKGSRLGHDTRVSANFNTPFTIIIEKDAN